MFSLSILAGQPSWFTLCFDEVLGSKPTNSSDFGKASRVSLFSLSPSLRPESSDPGKSSGSLSPQPMDDQRPLEFVSNNLSHSLQSWYSNLQFMKYSHTCQFP